MVADKNELNIIIRARNLTRRVMYEVQKDLNNFGHKLKNTGERMDQMRKKWEKIGAVGRSMAIGFGAVAAATGLLAKAAITASGEWEQFRVSFETMLGSADRAADLMEKIQDFAKKTPFQLPQVVQGTKTLLAMGIAQKDVLDTMRSLGDVSAGLGVELNRLILNYGQVKTQTKLTGMELRDFLRAGVPLIGELSKVLNVSEAEVKRLVSAGKVGFKDVEKAFQSMTREGGKFANLMEKQSQTLLGQISNLQDSLGELARGIGEHLLPVVKLLVAGMRALVDIFNAAPKFIKIFIAALLGVVFVLSSILTVVGIFLALTPSIVAALTAIGISSTIAFAGIPLLLAGAITAITLLVTRFDDLVLAASRMARYFGVGQRGAEKRVREAARKAGLDPDKEVAQWKQEQSEARGEIERQRRLRGKRPPPAGAPLAEYGPQVVDFKKELKEFQAKEKLKVKYLKESLVAQGEAISAAEEKLQDLGMSDEERALAEVELEKQKNKEKLDILKAYYESKMETGFKHKAEEMALEEFFNDQRLALINEQIDIEIALKERQYEHERAINLKTARDFLNLIDFKKKMTESQAKDFANWENFMASATSSKSKEVAAIAKAMAIYNVVLKSSEAAMSAYAALAGIPIVGPGLGIAAAAAALAYGAEQAQNIANTQPALAEGGIVPATPGGRLVRVGEGGEDEEIRPLSKGTRGLTVNFNSVFPPTPQQAAQIGKVVDLSLKKLKRKGLTVSI